MKFPPSPPSKKGKSFDKDFTLEKTWAVKDKVNPPLPKKEKVSTKTSHWRKPGQLRTKSIRDGFWKILGVLKYRCRSYT